MHDFGVEQLISHLYKDSASVSLEEFPTWALNLLRQVINFDGAIWGVGHNSNEEFHTQTAIDISPDIFSQLKKYVDINPIFEKISAANGNAVDMADIIDDENFYQSDLYIKCFQPFGIERILSSIHLDQRSGIFNLLTLYRTDRDNIFLDAEHEIQNRLLYHLLSAASHRQLIELESNKTVTEQNNYSAICNIEGIYHSVSPNFLDLIETQPGQTANNRFPFEFNPEQTEFTHGKLQFELERHGELFRLTVRVKNIFDRLSDREQQVVDAICQGCTFKQAARELNLAPSTVSNHLYRIYTKLGIHKKSELIEKANQHLK